jgi:hypothetical protein
VVHTSGGLVVHSVCVNWCHHTWWRGYTEANCVNAKCQRSKGVPNDWLRHIKNASLEILKLVKLINNNKDNDNDNTNLTFIFAFDRFKGLIKWPTQFQEKKTNFFLLKIIQFFTYVTWQFDKVEQNNQNDETRITENDTNDNACHKPQVIQKWHFFLLVKELFLILSVTMLTPRRFKKQKGFH